MRKSTKRPCVPSPSSVPPRLSTILRRCQLLRRRQRRQPRSHRVPLVAIPLRRRRVSGRAGRRLLRSPRRSVLPTIVRRASCAASFSSALLRRVTLVRPAAWSRRVSAWASMSFGTAWRGRRAGGGVLHAFVGKVSGTFAARRSLDISTRTRVPTQGGLTSFVSPTSRLVAPHSEPTLQRESDRIYGTRAVCRRND